MTYRLLELEAREDRRGDAAYGVESVTLSLKQNSGVNETPIADMIYTKIKDAFRMSASPSSSSTRSSKLPVGSSFNSAAVRENYVIKISSEWRDKNKENKQIIKRALKLYEIKL